MSKPLPQGLLQGRRILVAEDDYVTAFDIKAELESLGAEVLGPVPDLEGAMDLLRLGAEPDGAILDINLGGEMVYPLTDVLHDRHVPCVFATGYDAEVIPDRYAHLPCLEKPLNVKRVAEALAG